MLSKPTRVRDIMLGASTSVERVLSDFLTLLLLKIGKELTIEWLIKIHQLVSGNAALVLSNLRGGRHGHLALTMISKKYASHRDSSFVPLHNPKHYPPTMGNAQDQALKTENSWQNQAQFQKYTALDVALKNQIIMTLEPVFLSPLVDQLTWSW